MALPKSVSPFLNPTSSLQLSLIHSSPRPLPNPHPNPHIPFFFSASLHPFPHPFIHVSPPVSPRPFMSSLVLCPLYGYLVQSSSLPLTLVCSWASSPLVSLSFRLRLMSTKEARRDKSLKTVPPSWDFFLASINTTPQRFHPFISFLH